MKINYSSTHFKVSWESEYFIYEDTILTFAPKPTSVISINEILIINQQDSDILSIFREIDSPSFNKPLVFYQIRSNIQRRIQQASEILSI